MKRFVPITLLAAGFAGVYSNRAGAADQPAAPTPGIVNPFDKDDPAMQKLQALDWKGVNFDEKDMRTKCVSLLALNTVVSRIGSKSDARLDLLIDYFNEQKIGEDYAGHLSDVPDQHPISYEDAKKVAVAFLSTPMGTDKFGDDLEGCDDNTLRAYQRLYDKSARASYEQTIASRLQVASMGMYLQKLGKFDEFTKWAIVERQKRQDAYAKETAQKREQYVAAQQAEKEARTVAYAQSQAKAAADQEIAAKQMEAGIEYQEQSGGGSSGGSDQWYGDNYWPWTGAYYSSNAYRGAVADRARNAYSNWNGARRAGGGRRR